MKIDWRAAHGAGEGDDTGMKMLPKEQLSDTDRAADTDRLTDEKKIAVIVPAFNEEESIGPLIDELRTAVPEVDIVVINDGSSDLTAERARAKAVTVLDLPCNIGVGGAVQTGFCYAFNNGYQYVIRIDGDGQHPPAEIPELVRAMTSGSHDLVIGSRFIVSHDRVTSVFRTIGIKLLAIFLSGICRSRITDPTSGFWMINRQLLYYFANDYPTEYPEPEAIALMRRYGFSYTEVGVKFRPRRSGRSSIRRWGTLYYIFKVGLALVVDRIRPINPRYQKSCLREIL